MRSLPDLKLAALVWRVDWRLRGGLSAAQRRRIRHELASNLASAAEDFGPRGAAAQFGLPDEIASDYLDAERPTSQARFRPAAGARAGVIALGLVVLLQLIRIPSFGLTTAEGAGSGRDQWQWKVPYLFLFSGDLDQGTLVESTVYRPAYLILPVFAFVLVAWGMRRIRARWLAVGSIVTLALVISFAGRQAASGGYGSVSYAPLSSQIVDDGAALVIRIDAPTTATPYAGQLCEAMLRSSAVQKVEVRDSQARTLAQCRE